MARFIGTFKDFKQYVNDYVKNKIPYLTRKFKTGTCELCGKKATLDAAHLRGREREVVIREAFEASSELVGGNIFDVDLNKFAQYINKEHSDPNNFHFICHDCHRKYDAPDSTIQESDFKKFN